jgi:hypothetical protein
MVRLRVLMASTYPLEIDRTATFHVMSFAHGATPRHLMMQLRPSMRAPAAR